MLRWIVEARKGTLPLARRIFVGRTPGPPSGGNEKQVCMALARALTLTLKKNKKKYSKIMLNKGKKRKTAITP